MHSLYMIFLHVFADECEVGTPGKKTRHNSEMCIVPCQAVDNLNQDIVHNPPDSQLLHTQFTWLQRSWSKQEATTSMLISGL